MVMLLASLKQVPRSLYEAASIDGASKWHQFWHVTIPQISPIIFFNMIMQTIQALQNFTSSSVSRPSSISMSRSIRYGFPANVEKLWYGESP